jgi:hypothetical protein
MNEVDEQYVSEYIYRFPSLGKYLLGIEPVKTRRAVRSCRTIQEYINERRDCCENGA